MNKQAFAVNTEIFIQRKLHTLNLFGLKKQTQTKIKPQYLYASVIILDK